MAENLIIDTESNKQQRYETLLPQLHALVDGESNTIANISNIMAALHQTFGWLWIGVYLTDNENELVLGPFQGPIACTRIRKGKGVCGTSWEKQSTIIVPDVEAFPGHIACSSLSRSEIVVPIVGKEKILGVIDADSVDLAHYDEIDQRYLEQVAQLIARCIED